MSKRMSKKQIKYILNNGDTGLTEKTLETLRKESPESYNSHRTVAIAGIKSKKEAKQAAKVDDAHRSFEAATEIAVENLPHFAKQFTPDVHQKWIDANYIDDVPEYLMGNKTLLQETGKILAILADRETYVIAEYDTTGVHTGDYDEFVEGSSKYYARIAKAQSEIINSDNPIIKLNAREVLRTFDVAPMVGSVAFLSKFKVTEEWLIEGIIPANSKGQFYGMTDSYKTFQVLHMLFCIANGLPWYGKEVKQGKIVYLAGEGQKGLNKRIEALEAHYKIKNNWTNFIIKNTVQIADEESMKNLSVELEVYGSIEMLTFDTLANASVGLSENSSDAWSLVMERFNTYLAPKVSVISWVHHSADDKSEARGSKAKKAAIDWEFKIKGTAHKKEKTSTLVCRKMKDAERADTMVFEMKPVLNSLVPIVTIVLSKTEKRASELVKNKTNLTKDEFKLIIDGFCEDDLKSTNSLRESRRIRKALQDKGKVALKTVK